MGQSCAIHTNAALAHQVRIAHCLAAGFKRHGIKAIIANRDAPADLHVVMGPWFALERWRHSNTLYIDRAYWGDPDNVSIHWLKDGEKDFTRCELPRAHPALHPYRESQKRIYLCDYGHKPRGHYDAARLHPTEGGSGSLVEALEGFGVSVGRRTTALIDAAILGLVVETEDEHSPAYPIRGIKGMRADWLTNLAWHNWSLSEIENGTAWEYLNAIGHSNAPC